MCFAVGVMVLLSSEQASEPRAAAPRWASEGKPGLFWRRGGRKLALLMSNDCGFLANIKEEGTKNTYQPLCQNATVLRTYQANMLKHFQSETDRTKHQGQSHFTPSPGLSLVHRRRGQAPALPHTAVQRRRRTWWGPQACRPQSRHPHPAAGLRVHCLAVPFLLPEAKTERATSTFPSCLSQAAGLKPQTPAEGR